MRARGACAAILLLAISPFAVHADVSGATPTAPARQSEIIRLVRNDCGSCHGLTLQGGLGPALVPSALQGKPDIALRETILRGRTGTAMPPWAPFLSEQEAEWVVEQLKKGFPHAH